jgi:hypothetical protein
VRAGSKDKEGTPDLLRKTLKKEGKNRWQGRAKGKTATMQA